MEIRIATINVYVDAPTPFFDSLMAFLSEREAEEMPAPQPDPKTASPFREPEGTRPIRTRREIRCDHSINCPHHGDGDCDEDTRTGEIRTGPRPEPTAHDLIMQMEGSDEDFQPDYRMHDEWPDEVVVPDEYRNTPR